MCAYRNLSIVLKHGPSSIVQQCVPSSLRTSFILFAKKNFHNFTPAHCSRITASICQLSQNNQSDYKITSVDELRKQSSFTDVVSKLSTGERLSLRQALDQYDLKHNVGGNTCSVEVDGAPRPCREDLYKMMLVNSVPFIGFGFLDNFFMIIAGDYIEHTLGVYMCISTMAAAGLGNTISDVLGLGLAHYVESFCEMIGLRPPRLTTAQLELTVCRRVSSFGRAIGITIGCLLGMFPLWFINKSGKKSDGADGGERNGGERVGGVGND